MSKVAIVVPTNRPDHLSTFLDAWLWPESADLNLFVVSDSESGWQLIDERLGDNAWIISRQNAGIRAFGYLRAKKWGADYIITLDDDCLPYMGMTAEEFIAAHIARLEGDAYDSAWEYTLLDDLRMRGMPYYEVSRNNPVLINHGLWAGIPDQGAVDQIATPVQIEEGYDFPNKVIPRGKFFPMCTMNLAFKIEALPMMYLPLMGEGQPYDRFDDIWGGIFAKKICDHLGYAVTSGEPVIQHTRASHPIRNLVKEAPGCEVNEWLWQMVDKAILRGDDIKSSCYSLTVALETMLPNDKYWGNMLNAMDKWTDLTK